MSGVSSRKNLVVLRAGDQSLHTGWLAGPGPRDFDILVSYYGKTEGHHRDTADLWEHRPGPKWSCIGELLVERPELIERYEHFWFPDDDLAADTLSINRMFALFQGFGLKLAQPSLTQDSYRSWPQLLQREHSVLRRVAFVEVMAPLFTRSSLRQCLPSFSESRSGWGLDWVWPQVLGGHQDGLIGVIDAVAVKHTRPVGGELYKNNPELDPRRDSAALVARYGIGDQRALSKFACVGWVAERSLPWWERAWLQLKGWNAVRRARRRLRQGRAV
jgi:hypothetical protein